jgi:opacity protein-like surface antigen
VCSLRIDRRSKDPAARIKPALAGHKYVTHYRGDPGGTLPNSAPPAARSACRFGGCRGVDQKGWVAGGYAGYNWRPGPVMIGVELDISDADIEGSNLVGPCGALGPLGCDTKLAWFYTGRVRLGVPYGPVMPYVTGGAMVTGLKVVEGFSNPSGASPHLWGWVAGGGLEIMPIPQWVIKGEFLHGDMSSTFQPNDIAGAFAPGSGLANISEHNINIFRFGITYYLGADKGITSGVSSKY